MYKILRENPFQIAPAEVHIKRTICLDRIDNISAEENIKRWSGRMAIILVILTSVFVGVLGLHAYKQFKIRQHRRMSENEYNVAVTVWEYARLVKGQIDDAIRRQTGVLDFKSIAVPHSDGYRIWLELIGSYFRVYAVPARYRRTGTLSFLTDNTLSVRASDRSGQQATSEDSEYEG